MLECFDLQDGGFGVLNFFIVGMGIFIRLLIGMLSLGLAARLIPGIEVDGWTTLLYAAILMSVVNAIVKPLFIFFTLPVTVMT